MAARLEVRRWMPVYQTAYSVVLSRDGQHLAVGMENGVAVFNVAGEQVFAYPPPESGASLTVYRLAATPDLRQLYLVTRQGWLIRLDRGSERKSSSLSGKVLYQTDSDLHSIALAAEGRFIALGHLSPGIAFLRDDGRLLWRFHPDEGTAPEESLWVVALDSEGQTLYAGSAGADTNRLACYNAQSAMAQAARYLAGLRVTAVAILPEEGGVAASLSSDLYTHQIVAYQAHLSDMAWEREFDEPVTALAADQEHPLLAAGVGYEGRIVLLDSRTGDQLAPALPLKAVVNGLAIARGQTLAAATQDGHVALIRYFPEELGL